MLCLAQFSRPVRILVALLWTAGGLGLAGYSIGALAGYSHPPSDAVEAFYTCLYLVPATLCLLRAALVREERGAWALFGIGIVCFGAAYGHHFVFLESLASPPYPSFSDAGWLAYYGAASVALLMLMRSRLENFRRSLWIDASVGGLAIAALASSLLVDPILEATGGSVAAVATNMAYPLFDVLIVSIVLGVFAMTGWRPGRTWTLFGAVFAAQAVFDTIYLYQTATGTYQAGTLLDATWLAFMLLIAVAAWQRPTVTQGRKTQGWPALAITSGFAAVGLGLTTYDHWHRLNDVAAALSTLTLVAAFVRTAMTFGDMRSLARSQELLARNELILDAAGDGICGLDRDGVVTFANPAAAHLTGYGSGELIGRRLHAQIHHKRPDGSPYPFSESPVYASLADGSIQQTDREVYWRKDGTSFPVEYTSTPVIDDGRVTGAVVVFKDISERRKVERAKDEFTSVVSHELRTPLTSIRGSLGLLESGVLGALPEQGQRMVEIAVQNTDRLVRLINDILDIERINSGEIDMDRRICDASELIARATEVVASTAAASGVTIVTDAEPVRLAADADRVIQTLTNLIANAVKFSPAGGRVRVSCSRADGEVLFEVSDEGRGIPAENLETIFERFQQVDASDARDKGGTGLGLAICRSIVEQHGGRIWARSVPGEGATFSFVLPAPPAQDGAARTSVNLTGPRVLVCDDDACVVEVVSSLLEQRGYRPTAVSCGEQALESALADPPDAILLDLLMPGMSGWETAAALKQHAATDEIPIVILSVLAQADTEAPEGPVVGWIQKPLDDAELFAALGRAVSARNEPFRVLVVEDDEDLAGVLIATFARHGVQTFHAGDGTQAIEISQRVLPDLLVLDLGVPGVDGFEVVGWLRRHERLHVVPMVVYTARDLDESDRARLRLGATTEFLTKGRITPLDFEQRVMTLLGQLAPSGRRRRVDEPEAHAVGL